MYKEVTFLHAIDLNNRTACEYIVNGGSINSLFASTIDTNHRSDYYFIKLDDYRNHSDDIFKGAINPRCKILYLASFIRKGKNIRVGGKPLSSWQKKHYLRLSEIELSFEAVRRDIAPEAPSRLTCLYLADNSEDGRNNIDTMLSFFTRPLTFEVNILQPYIGFHYADNRWLEAYIENPQPEFIQNYWLKKGYDDKPVWEFLLEGSVTIKKEDDLAFIKNTGNLKKDAK